MMNMIRRVSLYTLAGMHVMFALSCNLSQPYSPDEPPADQQSAPTDTLSPVLGVPDATLPAATPESSTGAEIELRFTDAETQQECVTVFPVEFTSNGDSQTFSSSQDIDCRFEIQQCSEGVCVTYHSEYLMDATMTGTVLQATSSYPDGALDANLSGTFTMRQYWTDIPPETIMAFTADSPFEVTSSDIIPLFFGLVDGYTVSLGNPDAPWEAVLHRP